MTLKNLFGRCLSTAFAATLLSQSALAAPVDVRLAWTHYTGWEPWGWIADKGIAQKHIEASCGAGSHVRIELLNDYAESLNLYAAGSYQGVAATNMDALAVPGVGGVRTDMLVVSDTSNGNDAILSGNPKVTTVAALAGQKVNLVELTVSHYMLARALDMAGVKEAALKLVNTSDADIGSLYASQPDSVVVTWNPIVNSIRHADPKARTLFTSAQIPGEIIDAMVVRSDLPPCAKEAIQASWFEAIASLKSGDDAMIRFLAAQAGGTEEEFRSQMATTNFLWTRQEADTFVRSPAVRQTADYVRRFSFAHGLYNGKAVDAVGIRFPDGFVLGNSANTVVSWVSQLPAGK